MRKNLFFSKNNSLRYLFVAGIALLLSGNVQAQCPLSAFNQGGTITPTACGFQSTNNIGSGTYITSNVHNGGIYDFGHCNATNWGDDQITGYQVGSGVLFYNDDAGSLCGGLHSSATWASNFTGTIAINSNVFNCQGWIGGGAANSGVLDYRCSGPGNPATYGNGQWILYGYNAGDASGGAGAWTNCYSGFMTVAPLSFSTNTLWSAAGSPSDAAAFLGCHITPDNHSWSAKRTGFTCGVYEITVDHHDDLAQVIVNGNTTTLAGIGGPNIVYTGVLTSASTVEFRVSEGAGFSQAQITIAPVATGALNPGGVLANQTICPNGDPAPFTSSAGASGGAGTSVTGGSYTYDWTYQDNCTGASVSLGINSPTYDPPGPLNNNRCYARVVTDACGTTAATSAVQITIDQPPVITNISVNDAACSGSSTGSIQVLNVALGIPPYEYSNDGGATYQVGTTFSNLAAGSYNLAVRDVIGCSTLYSGNPVTIGQPTDVTQTVTKTDASCANVFDGSISVVAAGGIPPYAYSLNGGPTQPGPVFTGIGAGTYIVSVFDANGCEDTASITVNNTYIISVSIVSQTDISCFGGGDGTLCVQVNGGVPPYSYSLNGVSYQASGCFTGLSAGTYIVIGRDSKGCTETVNVDIIQPAQLTVRIDSVRNVLCNGDATGAIYITPLGGTPGYTYLWSDGAVTEDNTGLAAGVYNVTVNDINGCASSAGASVTEPLPLFLSVALYNDLLCFGDSSGAIDITANGGIPAYSFNWSNGEVTEDLANLQLGCYSVTLTDANACSATLSQCLTEPTALTSSVVGTDVVCFGESSGTADLTVGGGTTPYFYQWSTFQATQDVVNLPGGLYYVIITDNNGCQKRDSVFINEPSNPLTLSLAVTQISCFNANDGSIDLTVTGGTPTYTYVWSHGPITEDVSGLPGGTYIVTVTDANGCTASAMAVIINPLEIGTNYVVTDPLCFGDSTGSINLITSGGTPGYTFLWSNGDVTEDITNEPSGTYYVTITDSRNCVKIDSATLTDPPPFYVSGVIKHVTCFGYNDGEIDATAYGGTLPYSFNWSTGESTEDLWNLPGGSDTVYAFDNNGCQAVSIYVVREPQPLVATVTGTNALCFGTSTGTLTVVPSGGTTPYEYLWNNFVTDSTQAGVAAGRYVVLVTDSNGCHIYDSIDITEPTQITIKGVVTNVDCNGFNTGAIDITVTGGTGTFTFVWSHGPVTEDVTGLVAGDYTVTATDANGCSETATFTVTEAIGLFTTVSISDPTCFGGNNGFISVVVVGGTIPYTYTWSTTPPLQGATATNLVEGAYTLTVSDANGCSATVAATLFNPAPIVVTTTPTPSKCYNSATGIVTAAVTGGTPPYVYQLNGIIQASNVFSNLLPGNYIIAVRDANGCEGTTTFTITAPAEVTVDLTAAQPVILQGMTTQLIATTNSHVVNHFWSPLTDSAGNSIFSFTNCNDPDNCSNPYVTPRFTTTFTVAVMNSDSCFAYDTVTVVVEVQPSVFIPSAFTPNNDDLNDRFEFDILGATNIEVAVFNRWGEKLFYNASQPNGTSSRQGWDGTKDGKAMPHDTYVYQMKITYADGVSPQGLVIDKAGTVTIMR